MLGRMAYFVCNTNGVRTKHELHCTDNFVVAPDNPMIAYSADLFSQTQAKWGGNAYWQTIGTLNSDDRSQKALRLLSRPVLKSIPALGRPLIL